MDSRKWGIVGSYINTILTMFSGLYLSSFLLRILGDTEYGIYQTVASFANYLVLLEFGTGSVMTRNLSLCYSKGVDKGTIERNISTVWVITCLLAGVIIGVSVVFYEVLDEVYSQSMTAAQIVYGRKILIAVTVNLILSFFQQTISGIVLANENYTFSVKLSIIKTVLKVLAFTCILLEYRHSVLIAIIDSILTFGIALYSYLYCKIRYQISFSFRKFDKSVFKASLPLSMAIFVQAIVNQANSNVDKFIIGIKLNPESVALYGVALFVYSVFSQLTTVPITMYAPQTMKNVAAGIKGKQLIDTLVQPSRLVAMLGGCILFGFIAVGRQFISIVYGTEYIQAWIIGIIIMTPMLINMANGILINVLDATNKRMVRSGALLITTVANVVLTVWWIDVFGMIGAALATAICTCVGQITLMNIYYSKKMQLPIIYMYKEVFRGILPFQIAGAIIAMMVCALIHNVYVSLLCGGFIFIAVVAIGYCCAGGLIDIKTKS